MMELESGIDQAAFLIARASFVTALVGAGISVESGIRAYRGADGIYTERGEPPMDGFQRFLADPSAYWVRLLARDEEEAGGGSLRQARPNAGHEALAEMERRGVLRHVITQNIDNLHRAAGQQALTEIHGNYRWVRCIGCHRRWPRSEYAPEEIPPRCLSCRSLVKSDVVDFGEPIPPDALRESEQAASLTDCMLLVGTTGLVYPAAGYAIQARANGASLIEVNPEPTALTDYCDVALRGPAGAVLPRLIERMRASRAGGD